MSKPLDSSAGEPLPVVPAERSSREYLVSRSEWLGMFIVVPDGRILDANAQFFTLTGYDRSDLPTLRWTELTPPGYEDLSRRMFGESLQYGRTPPYEKEYVRKDGSRISLLLFGTVIDTDVRICDARFLFHAVDLRAVARAGSAAGLVKREPGKVFDAPPHIVWRSDAAGRNLYFNDAWYAYTGLSPDESRGSDWTAPLQPDDVARVRAAWEQTARGGPPPSIEFRVRSASGAYEWFASRATALRDESGTITQYYGTLANIDEQRRTERESTIFAALSTALAGTSTLKATTDAIVRTLVTNALCEWATIALVDTDGAIRIAAVHHADAAKRLALEGLMGWSSVAAGPCANEPRITRSSRDAHVFEDVAALYNDIGYASAVAVPLIVNGTNGGTLKIVRSALAPGYAAGDVAFLSAVAERAGAAIAGARLYERERKIATTFQNAVLPPALPNIPGLRFDSLYQAGQEEALVGGDWYDAFRLPDGRCVIAIGDVSGSGLRAATLMAEARQTMRGAAAVNPDPRRMLAAADRILSEREGSPFATAWIGIIDPIDFSLVYAGAGHPAPVLLTRAVLPIRNTGFKRR